ncbi:alanine racemase [Wohlfahrtiimonas chitiniclastica]|uniref:alanine racemase n=1 Tax=Wohlfahrtiimonas chitiniclastica TaxID=400946 RepID=UPI001BCAA998|nr:alanine racemase [Wohlfahrtiimonas chitiniclastica]MBS7815415.1 alanine racemase [Wohlfahrtiimonas chitiniclastica]
MRPLKAYLSKSALLHNVAFLQQKAPNSQLCTVLKANAYGHRVALMVPILEHVVNFFAVAAIEEAETIRTLSNTPIILLEGVFEHHEYHLCDEFNFIPAIGNAHQLNGLLDAKLMNPIDVFIKINSGMNRLGIRPEELAHYYQALNDSENVKSIQLMTHLACADEADDTKTRTQLALMANLPQHLSASISNSANIFDDQKPKQSIVRAGLALYGASPFDDQTAESIGLKPILELRSKIIHVNHIKAGEHVGYGATFTAPHDLPVGVVACGYADGYPREVSKEAYVLIDGYKAPLIGRVAMDMFMVDLSAVPESKWDREVILFGEALPIEYVAQWAGTIPYTIFTHLAARIHFNVID